MSKKLNIKHKHGDIVVPTKTTETSSALPAELPAPWLSVVIPAYNCKDTIEALLDSILIQNDPDVEIIICDDHSTDGFMEKVYPYADKLNIFYIQTEPREIHCPGNTRLDGWHKASGTWLTFIDNDDMFEPNAFAIAKKIIEESKEDKVVFTAFRDWYPERNAYGRVFNGMTWMHGKFYNRQWLIDNGIDFKENLKSHEDLWFNGRVFSTIFGQGKTYHKTDSFTYKWVYKPDSESRRFADTKHSYVETFFHDYVTASAEPWFIGYHNYPEQRKRFVDQFCSIILYCYFYYQSFEYSVLKEEQLPGTLEAIKYVLYRCLFELGMTKQDFIDFAYNNPEYYALVKKQAECGSCNFVETTAYREFIEAL